MAGEKNEARRTVMAAQRAAEWQRVRSDEASGRARKHTVGNVRVGVLAVIKGGDAGANKTLDMRNDGAARLTIFPPNGDGDGDGDGANYRYTVDAIFGPSTPLETVMAAVEERGAGREKQVVLGYGHTGSGKVRQLLRQLLIRFCTARDMAVFRAGPGRSGPIRATRDLAQC
jgi:hypothetical protein